MQIYEWNNGLFILIDIPELNHISCDIRNVLQFLPIFEKKIDNSPPPPQMAKWIKIVCEVSVSVVCDLDYEYD